MDADAPGSTSHVFQARLLISRAANLLPSGDMATRVSARWRSGVSGRAVPL